MVKIYCDKCNNRCGSDYKVVCYSCASSQEEEIKTLKSTIEKLERKITRLESFWKNSRPL